MIPTGNHIDTVYQYAGLRQAREKEKAVEFGGRVSKTIDSFLWRKSDRITIQNVRHAARVLLDMMRFFLVILPGYGDGDGGIKT